jgi:adenine deaminase
MRKMSKVAGNIIDLFEKRIFQGEILINDGIITHIMEKEVDSELFITPGLIDAHIHIESSMLSPQNFSEVVVRHGTVALVSDPHEIANVLGMDGINYMKENSGESPVKFYFGAPSCVPATSFETSGAVITSYDIENLFKGNVTHYLSEMMNFPGLINGDPEILKKLNVAKKYKRKIDGHAPGLSGNALLRYVSSGIDTDHECVDLDEAIEKILAGMKILIREGSAAKNFNALFPLIDHYPGKIMFCSDDLHPDDLMTGHINKLVKLSLKKGADIYNVFRACTVNPSEHYSLNAGLLRIGDPADICVFDSQREMNVLQTIIDGKLVYDQETVCWQAGKQKCINKFVDNYIVPENLAIPDLSKDVKVIKAFDGELITKCLTFSPLSQNGVLKTDIERDILKITVLNRYKIEKPSIGLINGFNLKRGAIASSIAHDSHNVIAVGVEDESMAELINWIVKNKGGVAVHDGTHIIGLQLPIAGIMSDLKAEAVSQKYSELNKIVKSLGCKLDSPFMTLSFMSLLVIPELKLSDKGLFDAKSFAYTELYTE